ncbi:MAG: 50S ribosomal protein L6 [Candidatus Komeilibacteria bacterium]|nr:50S ribosomal protein L6 [Candidatus Komeilibacteria bacterium]
MSRVGKSPIIIPDKVEVKLNERLLTAKGPKGELTLALPPKVEVAIADKEIRVSVKNETDKSERSLWGTGRSLINNVIMGVSQGFSKQLEINGVGFKAAVQGQKLVLNVGFSHPVEYQAPAGIDIAVEKNVITISGYDRHLVGQTAANIREIKKPEPYKGKGIKYMDEIIRRKAGKAAKGGEK